MSDFIHPARTITFDALMAGLEQARADRWVYRRFEPGTGLSLFRYSEHCVYDNGWNPFSLLARGLILDEGARRVVATPFPKFFNMGEHGVAIPALPFETFEKLDGSLIIIFHHDGRWMTATKGAFDSAQAKWAQARLDAQDLGCLEIGATYLAEAVYPENRIVVHYAEPALVMLAAYAADGRELAYADILAISQTLGWRAAARQTFSSIEDLVAHADKLPSSEEGFVLRFTDGLRLKVKGAEYRRIHALISRCTPIAVWEAMLAGDDLGAIRRDLPEEFWVDFDAIIQLLGDKLAALEAKLVETIHAVASQTDKEIGLSLPSFDASIRPYVFVYRKKGPAVAREKVLRSIRPTANALEGYTPSKAMDRLIDEMI